MRIARTLFRIALVCAHAISLPVRRCLLRIAGLPVRRDTALRGLPYVRIRGTVFLGHGVRLNSGLAANPIGGDSRLVMICEQGARISIGDRAGLSNVALNARTGITIGERTLLGGGVKIYDHDFHSLDPGARNGDQIEQIRAAPVEIGADCFVGAHTIILKGVTIGDGVVVGAGSVVTRSIPAGEIWGGNPARQLRSRHDERPE